MNSLYKAEKLASGKERKQREPLKMRLLEGSESAHFLIFDFAMVFEQILQHKHGMPLIEIVKDVDGDV